MTTGTRWLLALAAAACSAETGAPAAGDERSAFRGGIPDRDTPRANATVAIGDCTGTLVAPDRVLTAGDCIPAELPPHDPDHITAGARWGEALVVATRSPRGAHTIRLDAVYEHPWQLRRVDASVRAIAGGGDTVYGLSKDGWILERDRDEGAWVDVGQPPEPLAAFAVGERGRVFGVTREGDLLRREPSTLAWIRAGRAGGALALARAGRAGLFGVFDDGSLRRWRSEAGWETVGSARGARTLATDGGFLYATTADGELRMRRAVPWQVAWRSLGGGLDIVSLAVRGDSLVGLRGDDAWLERPTFTDWRRGDAPPWQIEALARAGSGLFAVTARGHLAFTPTRSLSGPWADLGPQPPFGFRGMTARDGTLYAVTAFGLVRRPASTHPDASWEVVPAPGRAALRVREITAAGGALWGVTTLDRLVTRPVTHRAAPWTEVGDAGRAQVLAARGDDLVVAVSGGELRRRPAVARRGSAWTPVARPDRRHPLESAPMRDPVEVVVGNDSTRFVRRVGHPRFRLAERYLAPGGGEVALVSLSVPIPARVAVPADPLTRGASGDPGFWPSKELRIAGWRGRISPRRSNQMFDWTEAGWAAFGSSRPHTVDLAASFRAAFALDADGTVWRRAGDGSYSERVFAGKGARAIAAVGDDLWIAGDRDVRYFDVSAAEHGVTLEPPLAPGERIEAIATRLLEVWVATDRGRIVRTADLGATWRREDARVPLVSMASSRGTLFGLSEDRLYRQRPGSIWEPLGAAGGLRAIAAERGRPYAAHPGMPRFRELVTRPGGRDPYARPGALGRASLPQGPLPGASVFWRDERGDIHLVGVAGGVRGRGLIPIARTGGGVVKAGPVPSNVGAFLDHHLP